MVDGGGATDAHLMQLPLFVPKPAQAAPVAPLDLLPPWRRAIAVDAASRGVPILVSPPDIGELWPLPRGGAPVGGRRVGCAGRAEVVGGGESPGVTRAVSRACLVACGCLGGVGRTPDNPSTIAR